MTRFQSARNRKVTRAFCWGKGSFPDPENGGSVSYWCAKCGRSGPCRQSGRNPKGDFLPMSTVSTKFTLSTTCMEAPRPQLPFPDQGTGTGTCSLCGWVPKRADCGREQEPVPLRCGGRHWTGRGPGRMRGVFAPFGDGCGRLFLPRVPLRSTRGYCCVTPSGPRSWVGAEEGKVVDGNRSQSPCGRSQRGCFCVLHSERFVSRTG